MPVPRIAVDMDEVLADVRPKFLDLFEAAYGRRLSEAEYWGKKIYQVEGCREALLELHRHYELFIVTAAMEFRASLEDKYDWLQTHLPFIPWSHYVFCGDKSIIAADYMIDDHPHNLKSFRGKGLLFTASHNVKETGFTRVDNWQEVLAFFERERSAQNPTR